MISLHKIQLLKEQTRTNNSTNKNRYLLDDKNTYMVKYC